VFAPTHPAPSSEVVPGLADLEAAARAVTDGLDPDAVPGSMATAVVERLDHVCRIVTAARTLMARRLEEAQAWAGTGHRSAAELLAAMTGSSLAAARSELETSAALPNQPDVRDGLREGRLSPAQGAVIADAATADPRAAARLVDEAARSNLNELRQQAGRIKAAADPDPDATHARIHKQRRCSRHTEPDGTWVLVARGTAEDGAVISSVLDQLIDQRYRDHSLNTCRDGRDAAAFDALVDLARQHGGNETTTSSNPRFLALLRADVEALQRGAVEGEELCEITGIGPVPVSRARELLGESVLKLVITKGVDVLSVTSLGRGPTAAQKVALAWMMPTCTAEGCSRTHTENDHRIEFRQTHHTRLDELDPLCDGHHDMKTRDGWALVEGKGKRPFVPPSDPRHPRSGCSPALREPALFSPWHSGVPESDQPAIRAAAPTAN
jgi:hypothetical protein